MLIFLTKIFQNIMGSNINISDKTKVENNNRIATGTRPLEILQKRTIDCSNCKNLEWQSSD